ncbi:hypothetical protein GTW78_25105 [Streptomyces sp. SID4948]|nr:hypothetical protein [Streptomyces sp. SID4948]
MSSQASVPIVQRQNDPEMLQLLRAAAASHARAQRFASGHVAVSAALAAGAVAGVFVPSVQTPLTLLGLLWAVVYAVGASAWTRTEFRRAALFQETFDTGLFGLPWNHVLAGPGPRRTRQAATRAVTGERPANCATTTRSGTSPARSMSSPANCKTSAGVRASAAATPPRSRPGSSSGSPRGRWPAS